MTFTSTTSGRPREVRTTIFIHNLLNVQNAGVHLISPMGGAASVSFDDCSPTLLTAMKTSSLDRFPVTILIHHVDDYTVPFTSSLEFATELKQKNAKVFTLFPTVSKDGNNLLQK